MIDAMATVQQFTQNTTKRIRPDSLYRFAASTALLFTFVGIRLRTTPLLAVDVTLRSLGVNTGGKLVNAQNWLFQHNGISYIAVVFFAVCCFLLAPNTESPLNHPMASRVAPTFCLTIAIIASFRNNPLVYAILSVLWVSFIIFRIYGHPDTGDFRVQIIFMLITGFYAVFYAIALPVIWLTSRDPVNDADPAPAKEESVPSGASVAHLRMNR